jgi:hypothetical protein
VCWLPSEKSDEEASREEFKRSTKKSIFEASSKKGLRAEKESGSPPGLTPSKMHPNEHEILIDLDEDAISVEQGQNSV